jgi:cation transport regulator
MPYKELKDLPEQVKDNLPKHAQEIYKEAFNNAGSNIKIQKKEKGMLEERKFRIKWRGQQ